MRIVIDMQGAQGSNQHRGIGRYTFSLAQAIVRNRGTHEVFLALNGLFSDTIEPIRAVFDGLLPQENIRVWQALGPVSNISNENDWRRRTAELLREAFLASLKPDIVLVSSLFEGPGDDAVTSIGTLARTVPTAVVLYDLIPLIQRHAYLENPAVEAWYERKLDHLRRADLLLAISESSRQEGIRYIGFSAEACVNISTAADPQFQPQQIDYEREQHIRLRYGLPRQFVMYTGGIDHRKNIEGLIRAYASLPKPLRTSHQLAIICTVQPTSRVVLEKLAKEQGLKSDELVLTGFVSEEDLLALYNLCKAFIFPSWHEGFGLPALEAMSCGRAVIGANTSSLPEVIGRGDALFDPMNDASIAEKLAQVLTDDNFRSKLAQHGLERAKQFSWDTSAQRAIAAVEALHVKNLSQSLTRIMPAHRLKLAYISPLPPERSGISDYSAELLPELSRHYDIDVIVAQDIVSDPWIKANCSLRSVAWFRAHADCYDRVLYHFGNSDFHQHMFSLLKEVPGIVVLHDFFLSGITAHMDVHGFSPGYWAHELYKAHGFSALSERFHAKDTADVVWKYPCSLSVIQNSLGVITHSPNSLRLAEQWYGVDVELADWASIPLLRDSRICATKDLSRKALGLEAGDFLVCTFGMLGPSKLNERLLRAWLKSSLARDTTCHLVFVGQNHSGSYGQEVLACIRSNQAEKHIRITGWADKDLFRQYLAAADIGVQLRTLSRGETSAAVLDCMNNGLATIVNANGSMADLADEAVWKLPDEFSDEQLIEALETLWQDEVRRHRLGEAARTIILRDHHPRTCAERYGEAIEGFYQSAALGSPALPCAIAGIDRPFDDKDLIELADAISISFQPRSRQRQLLVDISELVQRDAKSGIQRVVRSILMEWLNHPPAEYRVEPVYATLEQGYRYARRFTLGFLDCPNETLEDEPIEYASGDVFFGLDLQPQVQVAQRAFYQALRRQGVRVKFLVHDLLCIQMPQYFLPGAAEGFARWLKVVADSDGAVCVSKTVAEELVDWVKENAPARQYPCRINWSHNGADVDSSAPTDALPADADGVLSHLRSSPTFLMVGTLEPRKGHQQTFEAFRQLWNDGIDVNLVIVGKQGWMVESLVENLRTYPELNRRLFWLEGISDEYLEKIYAASTCLIAASYGEGFGLPLIEAAQHKLPIVARDIPVFREVAGVHAFYFQAEDGHGLASALKNWLHLYSTKNEPKSAAMPFLSWRQSAEKLIQLCTHDRLHN